MLAFISAVLLTVGVLFMLLAGVGMLRMPDLFLRMSASTKAATLGVGFIMLAVAIYFGDFATATRAVAIAIFLLTTAPVAAHLIGRAAYRDGVDLWSGTLFDDLRSHYDDIEAMEAMEATAATAAMEERDKTKASGVRDQESNVSVSSNP